VAGDANRNMIVMSDRAGVGVVAVRHDHRGGDGLEMVVCRGILGEFLIDATALM
jgi:hypothetical protein